MINDSDSTLDYGDLGEMTGIQLQRTFFTATRFFGRFMGKDFKPGFYTCLSLLERNPGITQKTLAACLCRDTSTLVPFLNHMEAQGWVIRERSKTDKRAHELYLTEAGVKKAVYFDEKVRALEQHIENQMGKKQKNLFLELSQQYEAIFLKLDIDDITSANIGES